MSKLPIFLILEHGGDGWESEFSRVVFATADQAEAERRFQDWVDHFRGYRQQVDKHKPRREQFPVGELDEGETLTQEELSDPDYWPFSDEFYEAKYEFDKSPLGCTHPLYEVKSYRLMQWRGRRRTSLAFYPEPSENLPTE